MEEKIFSRSFILSVCTYRKSYCTTSSVSGLVCVMRILVLYVMGKALTGKLSRLVTGVVVFHAQQYGRKRKKGHPPKPRMKDLSWYRKAPYEHYSDVGFFAKQLGYEDEIYDQIIEDRRKSEYFISYSPSKQSPKSRSV